MKKSITVLFALIYLIFIASGVLATEEINKPEIKTLENSIGMTFIYIEPGAFIMGSSPDEKGRDNDETQHNVTLSRGFYMQTTEITQGQWRAVMGNNPSSFKNCGDDCPVEQVSWDDVQEFIRMLNKKESGNNYRLPTEAEWEYAAISENRQEKYSGTDSESNLGDYAWYSDNSANNTNSVGQKRPNGLGLYDMSGNVCEWCQDWYGDYPSGSVTDPTGPLSGSHRVSRGGSWLNGAGGCRSADRYYFTPDISSRGLGFRLVKDVAKLPELESLSTSIAIAQPAVGPTTKETARDGRFIAYENGTVLDTQTNLMWAAKDNGVSITWANAKSYCENYRGGDYTDWRMPKQDELAGLFDKIRSYISECGNAVHLTDFIRLTCSAPWASEARDSSAAFFNFSNGRRPWNRQTGYSVFRALPVRSGK